MRFGSTPRGARAEFLSQEYKKRRQQRWAGLLQLLGQRSLDKIQEKYYECTSSLTWSEGFFVKMIRKS